MTYCSNMLTIVWCAADIAMDAVKGPSRQLAVDNFATAGSKALSIWRKLALIVGSIIGMYEVTTGIMLHMPQAYSHLTWVAQVSAQSAWPLLF